MIQLGKIVISDINCVKLLLIKDTIDFNLISDEIMITQQLYDEVKKQDLDLIKTLDLLKKSKLIKIYDIPISTDMHSIYKSLINGKYGKLYSKCESSSISIAIHFDALLLSNNKDDFVEKVGSYSLKWITLKEYEQMYN